MAQQHERTIMFENARIMFRNFSGNPGKFNAEGKRNFVIFLEPQDAEQLANDGYNIKELKPRDDQEVPQAYLEVAVNFRGKPPKIMLISSKGKTPVDENMAAILDWADFQTVDIIINRYEWEFNGKSGVKAYLKSMYATLEEDDLDRKYVEVPDTGQAPTVPDDDSYSGPAPF